MAGKGGVGKTTLGATIGLAAARQGLDVTLVELEGHSTLGRSLGIGTLGYEPIEIELATQGRLRARRITPDEALMEYLSEHGLGRLAHRLGRTGAIDVVSTAAPGIRDLLALGKIRQLEQHGGSDLIVVDAPAAGHAITFLRSPTGLADASMSGPLREQSDLVLDLLGDAERCQTLLVTLPEETPVNEVIETAFSLEDDVGIKLGPIVVNGVWPVIDGLAEAVAEVTAREERRHGHAWAAARFRLAQNRQQLGECERLATALPLPQIHLPHQFTTRIDRDRLDVLADHLLRQLDGQEIGV